MDDLNTCTYCGKFFTRERTLQVHVCEPKRKHLQKNEIYVPNDISLGTQINGMLLFGTNAVGKSSLIRSIGITII